VENVLIGRHVFLFSTFHALRCARVVFLFYLFIPTVFIYIL